MDQEKQKISFTRDDTVMVKGVAILLLLVHHMGAVNPGIPLLKRCDFILLVLTFLPWIYYMVKQDYMMHTDRECFYIFSFCIGIYLSKHRILNRLKEAIGKIWVLIATVVGVVVMGVLRLKLCLPADGFFAVSIICFCICTINRIPNSFVGRLITAFGRCEFELYLLHPVVFGLFSGMSFTRGIYRKVCLILFSMCGAYSWKQLKDKNFLFSSRKKNKGEEEKDERNYIGRRSGDEALPTDDGDLEAAITRVR